MSPTDSDEDAQYATWFGRMWDLAYRRKFERFRAANGAFRPSFNPAAMLPLWFLSRRLWLPFLAVVAGYALTWELSFPRGWVTPDAGLYAVHAAGITPAMAAIYVPELSVGAVIGGRRMPDYHRFEPLPGQRKLFALGLALMLVQAVVADWLLFRNVRRRVRALGGASPPQTGSLARAGRPLIVVPLLLFGCMAQSTSIMVNADPTKTKGRIAAVRSYLETVAVAQERYYDRHGRYAPSFDSLGLQPPPRVQVMMIRETDRVWAARGTAGAYGYYCLIRVDRDSAPTGTAGGREPFCQNRR